MRRMSAWSVILVVICSVGRSEEVQGGTSGVVIPFVSDGSWESSMMNPDGSEGPVVGPAQCVGFAHYFLDLSPIPGACWAWRAGIEATSPGDLQGSYLTRVFNILGVPTEGHVFIAVDDMAEVIVNGTVVGSTGSITDYSLAAAAQSALREFDMTPHLVTGVNTIKVRAQNGPSSFTGGRCDPCDFAGNPAGVIFGGSITFEGATETQGATWGNLKHRYR